MATKMPAAYSKQSSSDTLFDMCQDHSPYLSTVTGKGKAALMCWMEGEPNQRFYARTKTAADRKKAVLEWLAYSFNDTRAISLKPSVMEYNWADQPFARGAYTGTALVLINHCCTVCTLVKCGSRTDSSLLYCMYTG
jgi:hypothetical protein